MMESVWIEVSSSIYEQLIAFEKDMRKKDKGMGEQDTNFVIRYLLSQSNKRQVAKK